MSKTVVYVAKFDEDLIVLSFTLPKTRIAPGCESWPIPMNLGYSLSHLVFDGDGPTDLPSGDLTEEQYRTWRSSQAGIIRDDQIDDLTVGFGLGGLCVDVSFSVFDSPLYRTILKATVTNIGPYPIDRLSLNWNGRFPAAPGSRLIGMGYGFRPIDNDSSQILPGESKVVALIQPELKDCLSFASSLSPDEYYITIEASSGDNPAMHPIREISGQSLGLIIDELEQSISGERD
jgi:hypothetical protein